MIHILRASCRLLLYLNAHLHVNYSAKIKLKKKQINWEKYIKQKVDGIRSQNANHKLRGNNRNEDKYSDKKKWLNRQLYILLQSKSPNYSIYCLNNDGVMFEMRCVCFFLRELEWMNERARGRVEKGVKRRRTFNEIVCCVMLNRIRDSWINATIDEMKCENEWLSAHYLTYTINTATGFISHVHRAVFISKEQSRRFKIHRFIRLIWIVHWAASSARSRSSNILRKIGIPWRILRSTSQIV